MTRETVTTLTIKLETMNKNFDEMKTEVKGDIKNLANKIDNSQIRNDQSNSELLQKFEALIEKLDQKYAPKRTEKAWTWLITGVGGAVLVALLNLVLK